eukprot:TRINITY_DN4319_c0_g2_i1.p1 TRINITY_DN4319_c0_g2~~TRINITY_DN4319_c0_g2_i1.p1  ORF type:complete len:559 (+),score=171.16 TRINITY_DN4319_c0_g2_i1:28-1677(+)
MLKPKSSTFLSDSSPELMAAAAPTSSSLASSSLSSPKLSKKNTKGPPRKFASHAELPGEDLLDSRSGRSQTLSLVLPQFASLAKKQRKNEYLEAFFELPLYLVTSRSAESDDSTPPSTLYELSTEMEGNTRIMVQIKVLPECNTKEIKAQLFTDARNLLSSIKSSPIVDDALRSFDKEEDYILRISGTENHATNDALPLHRDHTVQICKKAYVTPKLELLHRSKIQSPEQDSSAAKKKLIAEVSLNSDITKLINADNLANSLSFESKEITSFRSTMTKLRIESLSKGHIKSEILPEYRGNEPIPAIVPKKIVFVCHFVTDDSMKCKLAANPHDAVLQVKLNAFQKLVKTLPAMKAHNVSEFVLKVVGSFDFIVNEEAELIEFDYIRRSLGKGQPIDLSLVLLSSLPNTVASSSGILPHESSVMDKVVIAEDEETNSDPRITVDITKVISRFRFKVIGIKNLSQDVINTVPSSDTENVDNSVETIQGEEIDSVQEKSATMLYICVEFYNCGVRLFKPVYTPLVPSSNPIWDQSFSFETLQIRQIPHVRDT